MLFLPLEGQFLPTDTVVDVPEIINYMPTNSDITGIAALILFLAGGTCLFFLALSFGEKKQLINFVLSLAVGVAAYAVGEVTYSNTQYEKEKFERELAAYNKLVDQQWEENRANLISNIESIYDIDKVELSSQVMQFIGAKEGLIDGSEISIHPWDAGADVVVYQDGKAYEALLTQDPETYEPSLSVRANVHTDVDPIRKK